MFTDSYDSNFMVASNPAVHAQQNILYRPAKSMPVLLRTGVLLHIISSKNSRRLPSRLPNCFYTENWKDQPPVLWMAVNVLGYMYILLAQLSNLSR